MNQPEAEKLNIQGLVIEGSYIANLYKIKVFTNIGKVMVYTNAKDAKRIAEFSYRIRKEIGAGRKLVVYIRSLGMREIVKEKGEQSV